MTRSVRQWSLFRPKGLASIATVALVEEVLFAVCAALRVNAANFNVMLLASVAACVMASLVGQYLEGCLAITGHSLMNKPTGFDTQKM